MGPILTRTIIASIVGIASVSSGTTISIRPDADAFVRSQAPTSNYGGGGALSVSGAAAVNGSGQQNGAFDTLMRFSMSDAVSTLDAALGQDWIVTGARLVVTEMAIPDSEIFNRGVGQFEIFWIGSDNWIEGTGRPNAPTFEFSIAGRSCQHTPSLVGAFGRPVPSIQLSDPIQNISNWPTPRLKISLSGIAISVTTNRAPVTIQSCPRAASSVDTASL